jgi:hypothetical protein
MLVDFLYQNKDIFVWKTFDMPSVPRMVVEHSLKIKPSSKPVKQLQRQFKEERRRIIDS